MKRIGLFFTMICLFIGQNAFTQSKFNDIPVSQLPAEVKNILEEYVKILSSSKDLEECAKRFTNIAGGGLVNEDPNNVTLRDDVKPYSLKKDYNNVKFYAQPVKITRVNVSKTSGAGFGASAVSGTIYKIWIAKADGQAGLPAPISIILPEKHPVIKTPKVIGIGSL